MTDDNIDLLEYHGGGGACGALDEDPRGLYWVAGLLREPDGTLLMHRFGRFAVASEASDPVIAERIAQLETMLVESGLLPPSTGNAGIAGSTSASTAVPAVAAIAVTALLLIASRHLPRRGKRLPDDAGRLAAARSPRPHRRARPRRRVLRRRR